VAVLPNGSDDVRAPLSSELSQPSSPPKYNTLLARLIKDDHGATAVEYGLIAALIAVAAVTVMVTVGTNLKSTFSTIAAHL